MSVLDSNVDACHPVTVTRPSGLQEAHSLFSIIAAVVLLCWC
jgi:hypothetical protein